MKKSAYIIPLAPILLCAIVHAEGIGPLTVDAESVDTIVWGVPSDHPPGPRNIPNVAPRQGSAHIVPLEIKTLPCGCSVLRCKHWHFPKLQTQAGMGFYFDGDFGGGIEWSAAGESIVMPYYGGGAYLFFDAEYVEFAIGFSLGGGEWRSADVPAGALPIMPRSYVNFGVALKYPLNIHLPSRNMRTYPIIGVDYAASYSALLRFEDGREYRFDGGMEFSGRRPRGVDLSAYWFRFGGGAEVELGGGISIRTEALYGVRGDNAFERRSVEEEKRWHPDARALRGHGLVFRVGLGVDLKTLTALGELTSM